MKQPDKQKYEDLLGYGGESPMNGQDAESTMEPIALYGSLNGLDGNGCPQATFGMCRRGTYTGLPYFFSYQNSATSADRRVMREE